MSEGAEKAHQLLARLTALLGSDVFFVPCEWGTKKPLVTYVERPFEGTKSPAYRALFDGEPRNIAVYLGKASGGLCAIDFDADEDLAVRGGKSEARADHQVAAEPRRDGLGEDSEEGRGKRGERRKGRVISGQ